MTISNVKNLLERFKSVAELRYEIFKDELSYLALSLIYLGIIGIVALLIFATTYWFTAKLILEICMYYFDNIFISLLILIAVNLLALWQLIILARVKLTKIFSKTKQMLK